MDRPWRSAFVIAFAACLSLTQHVSATLSKVSAATVKFTASGPAGISIVGESNSLAVVDDGITITVTAPLEPLHTGIGLRDRHMKEKYLEVAKFPNAELRLQRKNLQFPAAGATTNGVTTGELRLHGRVKQVTCHYEAKRDATGYVVDAKLRVNMKDFAIDVPTYLGVTVKPDVDIAAEFHVAGN